MRTIKILLAMFAGITVAACGGGSSTPASTNTSNTSNTISGIAAKGSIKGAEVLVFKAGDYSSSTDDSKALNFSSPALTDAAGRYNVSVSNYTGPVIIVVRPKTGSTMCDELTGGCTLVFNFRMRAVLPSVVANTTAHITPFTEMAAKAVGSSVNADVIRAANWAVRTQVLPGLDPLTTSPVVDSRVPTSEQVTQKRMVVALAAVAQAGTGTIGTTNCGAATDQIACAVDALSNTVTSPTATGVNINGANVAAFSTAMTALANIYVPTLGADGSLTTTAILNTDTDPDASTLITSVATNSTALGTGSAAIAPPSTTTLSGVDQAKAFFSDLRTTLHLYSNGANTGLLDMQATRVNNEMAGKFAPNVSNAMDRLSTMIGGADMFLNSTNLFQQNCSRNGANVICNTFDNNNWWFYPGMIRTWVEVTMTSSSANSVNYTATAMQCTYDASYACPPVIDTSKATGSGTISQTVDTFGKVTAASISGTFPGSQFGIVQDRMAFSGSLTFPSAGSQRLDFSGSMSSHGGTPLAVNETPMVTVAIGDGSYGTAIDVLHTKTRMWGGSCDVFGNCTPLNYSYMTCTVNCTYPELTGANVILVANTASTKFTGTLTLGNGMFDSSGAEWIPTTATFSGTIADTLIGGAGEFLTGKLELATSNYASYNATQPDSANNYNTGTATFTGTIAYPNAQPINLLFSGSATGFTTGTTSVNFSYGAGKSISVTSAPIDTSPNVINTVTLTNQDGIKFTLVESVLGVREPVVVTVGSTPVAMVSNNMINYADGYFESLN